MYIYERNKVGHRYFQRPLSSQGGSVFRQVRRGDAVQTAFTSGRAGWRRRGGRHPSPASRWAAPAAGQSACLRVRRWCCSAGQEIASLCWVPACLSETHSPVPATRLGPYRHACPAAQHLPGEGSFQRGKLGIESEFWSRWICTRFCAVYI